MCIRLPCYSYATFMSFTYLVYVILYSTEASLLPACPRLRDGLGMAWWLKILVEMEIPVLRTLPTGWPEVVN